MPYRSNGFRRLAAIVTQRCPRCLQGWVFATLFRMHAQCPLCRLPFEREPGYFTGAMYLRYGVAIIVTAPAWLMMAWLGRSLGEVLLVIGPLLVLGCPWLFRYARVLWLHLDQAFGPRQCKRVTRRRIGMREARRSHRATVAGILIGIGLGGFVDGIVLHQIAQWHHMLSNIVPPHTMADMRVNMTWDGLFHALTWVITLVGILQLRRAAYARDPIPSAQAFTGQLILGWGIFNLVEGVIDHQLLGIHNVREVPNATVYNLTFLAVGGVLFILLGWLLMRAGSRVGTEVRG